MRGGCICCRRKLLHPPEVALLLLAMLMRLASQKAYAGPPRPGAGLGEAALADGRLARAATRRSATAQGRQSLQPLALHTYQNEFC